MDEMKNNAAAPTKEDDAAFLYITEEETPPTADAKDTLFQSLRFSHHRGNPFAAFWRSICANIPRRGDQGSTLARKVVFLVALVVLICSLGYIVYDVVIQPLMSSSTYNQLAEDYQEENIRPTATPNYPAGMLAAFEGLYDQNPEVRGWLTFSSTDKKGFLKIDYPVMHSGDNEKYLTRDFHGNKSKSGALFFDMRHVIEPFNHENKVLIIYGHNMASGQMFAGLNKLIGRPHNARAATTLTLSTLFEKNEYKVFAAVMTDEDATGADYFSTLRVKFESDEDFLGYVEQVRARSLYDYPVDVQAEDELVVLSTCTGKSDSKVKNGRLVVFARRVRQGEDATVDSAAIVKNEDVIMPISWYLNQKLPPHAYYTTDLPDENGGVADNGTTQGDGTQGTTAEEDNDIVADDDSMTVDFEDLL